MKVLITGVLGQDGAYIANSLLRDGVEVHGATRRWSQENSTRLRKLGILNQVTKIDLDITDAMNCFEVISAGSYDQVFNLAANSFVGTSWANPSATTKVNSIGVLNLLEAIRRFSPKTKFYQASTSEMFGDVLEPIQSENTPFNPRSPYAVSKVYSHFLVKNYRESFGLYAVSGILFNHESPLRGSEFVTRKITIGLSKYLSDNTSVIRLGNLDAQRDWGYAPEYVEGMRLMMAVENPEDFVLATGETMSVRRFCESAAAVCDIKINWDGNGENEAGFDSKTGRPVFVVDKSFYRPAEVNILLGDPTKAYARLGWRAHVTGDKLAKLMMQAELEH